MTISKQKTQRETSAPAKGATTVPVFPFTALVGQAELKLALLLNVIEPTVGGALIMGQRGTGKSTAVRALAALLPPLTSVRGCAYNCEPADVANLCADCRARLDAAGRLPRVRAQVPVVELPLNATEDRVCGTISFERALTEGVKAFEPGLLARANRGFLYIDEVNLLEDHLVNLLLDAAATGRNRVEREGVSVAHPARFVLIGSGNPEEGELRPQLLDRFGLFVEIQTPPSVDERVEVVARQEAYARTPAEFCAQLEAEQTRLRRRIIRAQRLVANVEVARTLLRRIAELCQRLQVDGHRGELTITRAARALAAFEGRKTATDRDVRRVATLALRHRLRRDPLEQTASAARIDETVAELFGADAEPDIGASSPADEFDHSTPGDDGRDTGGRPTRQSARSAADGRAGDTHGTERPAPRADAQTGFDLKDTRPSMSKQPQTRTTAGRRPARGRATGPARTGRYVRASATRTEGLQRVALDATLRAAALRHAAAQRRLHTSPLSVTKDDLRFKHLRRRAGALYIFAIDTSGSMALNRINQAKGALGELLRQSYVNRERFALISFRERQAELILRPSRSAALARRLLDALPVGGATPLAAALLRAYEVARQARAAGATQIVLLVFTDGRANVPLTGQTIGAQAQLRRQIERELEQLGILLKRAAVAAVVVDTQPRFTAGVEGARLAHALGGQYLPLPLANAPRMHI